jgi:uncharacterized protein YbbC (DUF1343 family)
MTRSTGIPERCSGSIKDIVKEHGDCEVDIVMESEIPFRGAVQIEEVLGDLAYSTGQNRIKLLPEDF